MFLIGNLPGQLIEGAWRGLLFADTKSLSDGADVVGHFEEETENGTSS